MYKRRKSPVPMLLGIIFGIVLVLCTVGAMAYHDTLTVFVNGVRLTPEQIYHAEQAAGVRLRSGYYWYDQRSGYWGLVNGPVLGRVGAVWSQGNTVTEGYSGGGAASRNANTGIGIITDGAGGAFITR